MIVKYLSFLIGIIWSYSIIKTRSVFSTRTGIIFKIFIANISWLTLIIACYFGYSLKASDHSEHILGADHPSDLYKLISQL